MTRCALRCVSGSVLTVLLFLTVSPVCGQIELSLLDDITLANDALLMPITAPYGRAINGVSFQTEPFLTYNGYQYAAWYRAFGTSTENLMLGRRDLSGSTWEVFDTGENLSNGDNNWDAHNVVSLGISGDGRIHTAWDMHNNTLRYMNTVTGVATSPGGTWDSSIYNSERNSLNVGGSTINEVTYARFIPKSNGDMIMTYRVPGGPGGGSGNGIVNLATYDATSGLWDNPHAVTGNSGFYSDPVGTSNTRNAYLNGLNIGPDGTLHITWTWREDAGGANHDIMYAYSEDGGDTWKNNDGATVGTVGDPITIGKPGIIIDDGNPDNGLLGQMDRRQTLMNQQTQAVDGDGGVHAIMWHRRFDEPGYEWQPGDPAFFTTDAAYYHYYRDPITGDWQRNQLPTSRDVGSRPDIAYDEFDNLYVTYVSPGPGDGVGVKDYYTDGDLVIAGATKASGYSDWSILYTDTRDFAGEPFIDQSRLLDDGVLSVFIQENDDFNTIRTGTPLHVLDFELGIVTDLVWAGDDTGEWDTNTGTDWDSNDDDVGNTAFHNGINVTFDDSAATFNVNIANPVSPGSTLFANTAGNNYTITGASIGGNGGLTVNDGGTVTLNNAGNSYTGDTNISFGKLGLAGTATISASPNINISAGGTLDVTATTSGSMSLNGQTLTIDGDVNGDVVATSGSSVYVNSNNSMNGNLTVQSGSLVAGGGKITGNLVAENGTVRVGGSGLSGGGPTTVFADDFGGGGAALDGTTPDVTTDGEVWEAGDTWLDDGTAGTTVAGGANGQAAHLDFTPEAGKVYTAVATILNDNPNWIGFGFLADDPAGGDWTVTDFSVRHSNAPGYAWALTRNNTGANDQEGFLGGGTAGGQPWNGEVTDPTVPIEVKIVLDTTGANWTVEWFFDDVSQGAPVAYAGAGNPGIGGIGFSHDRNDSANSGGVISNFSVIGQSAAPLGETMTVLGDLTLNGGVTLELDIFDPTILDLLAVTGNFGAGGTLDVSLDAGAPAPQLGDTFDILDFGSASGGFSAYNLPSLTAGLAWSVSSLLTSGELQVVNDVDIDNDGDVDGDDFLIIQRTDPSLISAWEALYGTQVFTPLVAASSAVPEPASALLLILGLYGVTGRRRSLSVPRSHCSDC